MRFVTPYGLEGIVERRFKPHAAEIPADPALGSDVGGPEWEDRVAAIALRVVRSERELHPAVEPPA